MIVKMAKSNKNNGWIVWIAVIILLGVFGWVLALLHLFFQDIKGVGTEMSENQQINSMPIRKNTRN